MFGQKNASVAMPVQVRPPNLRIVNQHPGESLLLSAIKDDPHKEDLEYQQRELRASWFARRRIAKSMEDSTADLENLLLREMQVGGPVARALFEAWTRNGVLSERNFPDLDAVVAETPAFLEAATMFSSCFDGDIHRVR
jgi:hypothetical protein